MAHSTILREDFSKALLDYVRPRALFIRKDYDTYYGRYDSEAWNHLNGEELVNPDDWRGPYKPACSVNIPDDATVREESFNSFVDTYSGNKDELAIIIKSAEDGYFSCACGQYDNLYAVCNVSLGEAVKHLLGYSL